MAVTKVTLCFDTIGIGEVSNFTRCHPSYFGDLMMTLDANASPTAKRLLEFVATCRDHDREYETRDDPDIAVFDQFEDLTSSAAWKIEFPSGRTMPICSPYFLANGQVTFQPEDESLDIEALVG